MRGWVLWIAVLVEMAGIFYLSSLSSPPMPGEGGGFRFDILGHLLEYFVLGFTVHQASLRTFRRHTEATLIIFSIAVASGYGALDELHQYFVPFRSMELSDLSVDFTGAAAGSSVSLVVTWSLRWRAQKSRQRSPGKQALSHRGQLVWNRQSTLPGDSELRE